MNSRLVTLGAALAATMCLCPPAPADAPINLAASRPAPAPSATRVVIPPIVLPLPEATRQVGPSGEVTYWLHDHGPLIAVCTTFPATVYVDSAGNVYKQPVEIDAHGRERAVGAPAPLPVSKQVGGVTTTAKP